eukprot:gene11431-14007_t
MTWPDGYPLYSDSADHYHGFLRLYSAQWGYGIWLYPTPCNRHFDGDGGLGKSSHSQITCLQLMAKKIAVIQSTSGDVPDSGLDSLNQDGDSVEMTLARQLIAS